jgi:hypothetical protein
MPAAYNIFPIAFGAGEARAYAAALVNTKSDKLTKRIGVEQGFK